MKESIIKILCAMFIIVYIISIVWILLFPYYYVDRDTGSWLERAQVASDVSDMKLYLENAVEGMERHNLDEGHAALIFKKPSNDMTLIMNALNETIERCTFLEGLEENSTEYQVGTDDLRGTIRELDIHATYRWWVAHWYAMLWIIIGGILAFIGGIYLIA